MKLAQALYERDCPQAFYFGLDVHAEMIAELQRLLAGDPRFGFAVVPFRNAMYNPRGEPMRPDSELPVPGGGYDLLTMFSVVTHMTPEDAFAVFSILRRHAADQSRLVFSAFIDPDQAADWVDSEPGRPLLRAMFRKDFLEGIVARAGWRIERYGRPIPGVIQHHFVCSPGDDAA
ncbi:MAG: hypothetical protein KatS3mg118_1785 [Paracoccaceae bacterium]|nr:MAG: hypothetical protein KatS3mg118_1785 [Paracoccaceae bacterium]